MRKFFLELILAFLFCFGAIYSGYLFLTSYNEQASAIPLIAAVIFLGLSVFFLLKAGKTDMTFVAKPKDTAPKERPKSVFEQNNELVSSWRKTETQKERLRLLKLAGEVNNE
jgi:hypothetical protein